MRPTPRLIAAAALVSGLFLCPRPAEAWTEFRGPGGQGQASGSLPLQWSKRQGVDWQAPVPGKGWSSPVIAGGRVYLTSAVEVRRGISLRAMAFDASTGAMLWDQEIFAVSDPARIHSKNSHASPTPVHESGKLYVHFGHDGTACLDADTGKIAWTQQSLRYAPVHGNGGSPVIAGDMLIFSCDGASDPFLVALRKRDGQVAWQTPREVEVKRAFSFSTPLVIQVKGRTQVVSPASGAVIAYDPRDGREIWRCRYGEGYSVVPRPLHAHGMIYACSGYDRASLYAIRDDGEGDVTATHIAWETSRGVPRESSPVIAGDLIFFNDDKGVASCLDARTGESFWQSRLAPGNYSASPVHAAGRIYFHSGEGVTTVVEAAREFRQIAANDIGESGLASFGAAEGAVFIRTDSALFRVSGAGAE